MSDPVRLKRNLAALAELSDAEKIAAFDKVGLAVANFSGSLEELEKAVGMLMVGYHFASNFRRRNFGNIHWRCHCDHTDPQAKNNAKKSQLIEGVCTTRTNRRHNK